LIRKFGIRICSEGRGAWALWWKRVGLPAGLAEPSGEVGPVSQAPVDTHCFAGPAQAGVPFKHRSTDEVEYLGTGAPEINTGWVKERQLGESGKEGTVYEVKHEAAERCAMKEFKAKKATSTFLKEVQFQRDAALVGAAPAVRGVMRNPPRLVMEPMVRTLQQVLESQHGSLTPAQQKDLIQLCGRLDGAGIYHNDPNPLNLMEDCDGKFKWIDYGMSKAIDVSKNGRKPNTRALHAMLHGGMQGLVSRKVWTGDHSLLTKAIEGSQK